MIQGLIIVACIALPIWLYYRFWREPDEQPPPTEEQEQRDFLAEFRRWDDEEGRP